MSLLSVMAAWKNSSRRNETHRAFSSRRRVLLWALCLVQPIVRDWARCRSMMALRAWPKGRMKWRFSFPASRRKRLPGWRIRVFRWAAQSEVARWELLESLLQCARSLGFDLQPGSETDAWDLMAGAPSGRRFLLRTVTEYHEQGVRVTMLELRLLAGGAFSRPFSLPGDDSEDVCHLIRDAAQHKRWPAGSRRG